MDPFEELTVASRSVGQHAQSPSQARSAIQQSLPGRHPPLQAPVVGARQGNPFLDQPSTHVSGLSQPRGSVFGASISLCRLLYLSPAPDPMLSVSERAGVAANRVCKQFKTCVYLAHEDTFK